MAVEKVANYSAEMTEKLKADYLAGVAVEVIAESLGKTVRSVRAKLSREGVYKAKAKEAGKRDMLKAEMVAEISKEIGVSEEVLESLEKATSVALRKVLEALKGE